MLKSGIFGIVYLYENKINNLEKFAVKKIEINDDIDMTETDLLENLMKEE